MSRIYTFLGLLGCMTLPLAASTQSMGMLDKEPGYLQAVQLLRERPRSQLFTVDAENGVFIVADSLRPVQGDVGIAVHLFRWGSNGFESRPLIAAEPPLAIDVEVFFQAEDQSFGFAYVDERPDLVNPRAQIGREDPDQSYLHFHVFEWENGEIVERKHICGDVFWE